MRAGGGVLTDGSYQWCGKNTFEGSGYDKLVEDYTNYSLPVFFTEYGCNKVQPRQWQEVGALYSDKMTNVFSGGLVYEYSQESNDYGLVDIAKNGDAKTVGDFSSLLKAYAKAPQEPQIPSGATAPKRPADCPAEDDPVFAHITANHTLPTTLGGDMIRDGLGNKVKRGVFVDNVSPRATKYDITVDGDTVSNKEVKQTEETDSKPLAAGGHGVNTGGGVGKGAPGSSADSKGAASSADVRGAAFMASLGAVAFGFGLFL